MSSELSQKIAALLGLIETQGSLEILLYVRSSGGKSLTANTVAKDLSMTTASAERELALLCGRGFLTVTLGSDLRYAYRPMKEDVDAVLDELVQLWSRDRESVVRALARSEDPIRAFANAFRFRPGDDDG